MAAPDFLGGTYRARSFRVAKHRTQHCTRYLPGIVLGAGAHAILLSAYLLGAAALFVERPICRLRNDHSEFVLRVTLPVMRDDQPPVRLPI